MAKDPMPMRGGTKACDACRIRKIGCERADGAERCEPCLRAEIDCTYTHVRQKPGPQPGYRRKMRSLKGRVEPYPTQPFDDHLPRHQLQQPVSPRRTSPAHYPVHLEHPAPLYHQPHPNPNSHISPLAPNRPHPSLGHAADASSHASHKGSESTPSQPSYPSADPSPSMVYPMRRPDGHRPSWDITNAPGPLSVPSEFSGLGTYIDSTNPFDRVIRRELLNHLIHIYFEYMFWLMPYPHQPTMQRDLANRREEEPGQETFIAMVFSILGMVCVMPTHLTPLSPDQTSSLMAICEEQIMSYLSKREGVVLSHQRLFVAQCGAVICLCAGSPAKCRELIGSNMFIALQLNLDREATYATFDPLEAELWRRMWWLTYANDRSGATCEGARPILNEALCHSVRLPSCLTDEQLELAAQGLGSWQADPTIQSPMWGFYYCSAVWRVAGKVLTMREHDEAIAPKATEILSRVAELDMVIEELDDIFLDCPSWLMLTLDYNINSPESARASLNASTPSELSPLKQGIGVQQSNLWITQLAIRLVAVQHRKALLDLRWATPEAAALIASDPRNPDVVPRRAGFREAKLQENENKFREDRDHILTSLLRVLQALPMHQIACNAFPGLQKIRYIASTLLSDFDGLSTPSVDADEASRRSFKALTYLQEYIDYLARLEAMYAERAKGDTKM